MQFLKIRYFIIIFFITALIVLYFYLYVNLIIQAKSAILINANSGEIVYKNEETVQSAALSKLMTEYIVLEQLNDRKYS